MTVTVGTLVLKSEVHNIALDHLKSVINDLNTRANEKASGDLGVNEGQLELDRQSHNSEGASIIVALRQQVFDTEEQLRLLDTYKSADPTEVVDPGSLVVVEDQVFYVSTSMESFEHQGYKVTCISVHAPIYKIMEGLREGDSFECNDISYTIKEIV